MEKEVGHQEYTIPATADTPAHIVYLLDASGTMSHELDGKTRAEWLADALKYVLHEMIDRSYRGSLYRPRYKVSVVTYSSDVDGSLCNDGFIDAKEFWDAGLPVITPGGQTHTLRAFEYAYRLLEDLLKDPLVQNKCPAPLVCHVTDGQFNGGDPTSAVDRVKGLRNRDGAVLIQNLFIADNLLKSPIKDVQSWTGFMSSDINTAFNDNYAQMLFNFSSTLPSSYASVLADEGFNLQPGSRMMYPGQSAELIKLAFVTAIGTDF